MKCHTKIVKNKVELNSHTFEFNGRMFKCKDCPLEIDLHIFKVLQKKQHEQTVH